MKRICKNCFYCQVCKTHYHIWCILKQCYMLSQTLCNSYKDKQMKKILCNSCLFQENCNLDISNKDVYECLSYVKTSKMA